MESPEVHKNVSLFHMELKGKDVKGLKGEIKEEIEDYHFQPNILDHKYDQKHTSTAMDMIDVKIEPKEESDPDMNKSKRGYKLIQVAQKSNVLHDVNNQGEQPDIYDDYFETTEDSDRRSFEIEDQERANASMDHELSFQLNEEEPANVEDRKRNKTKFSDPQQWKYNAAKRKREYGLEYTGRKGKEFNIKRPKRTLKNRCKCSKIDTKIQCFKISNDDREEIFKNFWKLKWPEKRLYVSSRVLSLPTARVRDRKEKCSSRRSVSHQYFLNIKSEQIRVCKTLFCNTLGVSDSTVTAWIGNDTQSLSKSDDSLIEQPNNYDVFEDSRLQMLEECRLTEKLFIAKNLFGSSVGIPTRFVNIIEGEDLFHLPVNDFNQGETVQDTSEANVKTNNIKYHEGLEKTGQVSDKANNELKSENLLKLEESDFENNKHKNNDYFEATEDTDPSFEVEDQERTNASIGDELSFQLKEEEPEHFFADDDLNNQEDRKRSKRKFSDPQKWKYNAAKRKREYGLEYTGRKGKEFNIKRPKKTLKDRCKCSKIDTKIQCFKISNEDREEIFKNFWKLKWPEKRLYVSSRILSLPTARVRNRKEKRSSRRSVSHQYFLNVKSEQVRVCKTLFCNTLCVSDRTVTAWIESDTQSLSKSDDSLIGQPNNYDVFEDSRLQMLEECRVTEKLFIAKNLFGSSVGIPTRFVNNIIESEDLVHLPVVNDFNQGETVQDASEANVKTNNIKYHKGVEQRERLSKKANNELKNENLLELEESDFDNNKHKNNDYFETTEDSDPTCEVEDQEKANVSMDHELGFELNEEEPEHFFADDDLNNQKYRKRSKRKFSDPQKWKYNAAKRKREYGLEYTGRKGKEFNIKRPKKTLKDRCKCSKINTKIQCFKVSNEDREEIFKNFWKLKWPEKRLYVSSRVLSLPTARVRDRKEKCSSRRSVSHQYFLNVKSEQIRVCKTLFCNTLCVSDKTVTAWIESDTRSLAKNNDSLIAQPDNYDVFEDSKLQMLKECRLTEKLFNAKNTFDSSVGISTMFVNNITEGEDLFHLPVKYINEEETVQDATDANLNTNNIKCHEGLEKTGQVSEKANNELKSENLLKLEESDFENNKHKNNNYFETTEDTDPCFEVEDQERANASMDHELSFQLKEEEAEHFFADGDLNNQKYRKRSKRKFSDPQKWKYNTAKRKREYGLEYTGRKGKEFNIKRPKKTLKDRCKCSKINTKIQCFKVSNEDREEIFKNFWKLKWPEKRLYVSSRVLSLPTARIRDRKEKWSSRRSVSHQYFLNVKSEQIRVCKILFCNTLSVSDKTVTAWIESDTRSLAQNNDSLLAQPDNYDVFEDSKLTEKLFNAKNIFDSSVGISTMFVNNITEGEDLFHLPVKYINQEETVQDATDTNANLNTNDIKCHEGLEKTGQVSEKANNELKSENLLKLEDSDFENNKHKNNDYFETTEDTDPCFEVEDQERANASMDNELSFQLKEEEPEHFFADGDLNNQKYRKRSKRKLSDPQKWKYNAAKRKREYGLEYTGRKGKEFNIKRPKRTLKDRCKCSKIDTKIQCFKISNENREEIFKNFWKLKWSEKRLYVSSRVLSLRTARVRDRKEKCSSRRSVSHQYFLNIKSEQIRVCKTLFCNTLCVSDRTVTAWIESDTQSLSKSDDSLIGQPNNYDVFEDSRLQMLEECRVTEKLFIAKNLFGSSVGIPTRFVNNIIERCFRKYSNCMD